MKELHELRMFVVVGENEEYEIIEEKESAAKGLAMLEVKDDNQTFVELSINSVVGLNDPDTMKVKGKLRDMEIIVMIDCGATHNFILEKLVKSLQIVTKETTHYGVILGSGTSKICIKGDPSLTKTRISLKSMFRTWGDQDEGYLIECRAVEVRNTANSEHYMTEVPLSESDSVQMVLKQYGFDQKEEMEKLVEEILTSEETLGYQKNSAGGGEVLIRWKELPEHEASWESYDEIHRLYPTYHLVYIQLFTLRTR
ncbi:ty3-gypsy retrotransposon protein [Cucumis melo var. makuwa]|uniref:Ty3-gypsy retrotransposon protein n=1 Tax=Cucumis melo var. makuwa TaxID=1194695 RepID=A0A5D3C0I3_CUCMM|nr:ty3-gypsy retrotransposon protein [Cucumis melo var. makuwa]